MVSGIGLSSSVLPLRRVNTCYIEVEILCFLIDVLVIIVVILDRDFLGILVEDLDIKTDGLQFLDEDLEGFRYTRLRDVLPLDDGFNQIRIE